MENPDIFFGGLMLLLLAYGLPLGFMIGPAVRCQFEQMRAPPMPPYKDHLGDTWYFRGRIDKHGREGRRVWRCLKCRCQEKDKTLIQKGK